MTDHVYETADGERDIFDVKRKSLRRDGKLWRYSHPVVELGDIQPGAVMVEPDWTHTVYQAGDAEAAEWRRRGGKIDEKLNMPVLRNRAEIDAYQGMTRERSRGKEDPRYDFGPFRRGR